MDGFPHRSYEERHHHPHHHHPYPFPRQEEEGQPHEGERLYPPVPSVYEGAPPSHGPYAHTSSGPYGSAYDSFTSSPAPYPYSSSGPYGNGRDSGPYGTHNASDPYYSHNSFKSAGDFIASEVPQKVQLPQGHIVRIFCKKSQGFNLAVERDTVVMKPADTEDEAQQWIKDVSYGLRVKDNYGHPAFSLINKKTQKILKHDKEKGQQVLLIDYRPDIRDDDILWSESQDFGEGFKTVRCASDTLLNLTVFEGLKTVRNGSGLILDTWHKGDHQLWKLFTLW